MDYMLEKRIWTDADFEQMSWHDNRIYKFNLNADLEFDIDYIVRWNEPNELGYFTFWIAPATLVFKQPQSIKFDLNDSEDEIEIWDIYREVTADGIKWLIETHQGTISFFSGGYTQYIRQDPFWEFDQCIDEEERGGCSLERTTSQHNPKRHSEEILQRKQMEIEAYDVAVKCKALNENKRILDAQRERNEIDLKEYLLTSREYKQQLKQYNELLKGTRFEYYSF